MLRKVVRYFALAALVIGLVLVAYGAIVNQVAMSTFLTLLNQGGFKAFLIGILLVVVALVLLVMSLFVGRGRGGRQAPKQQVEPAPDPKPAAEPLAEPNLGTGYSPQNEQVLEASVEPVSELASGTAEK